MTKRIEIHFSTGVKYNGKYYLAAMHMNGLFMYDEITDRLTFLTSFQKEQGRDCLYLKAFLYKNEAWFIPFQAEYVAIVNLEKKSITYMPLLYRKNYCCTYLKYINILHFKEDFLCLIPQDVDAAMIIDLKNKKAKGYYGIVEERKRYPYHGAFFYEEKIYFIPWSEINILELDLETDERHYLPWNEKKESFGDVVYDEKTEKLFYAPARSNYINVSEWHNGICKKIKIGDWDDKEYKTYYTTNSIQEIFFWGHEKDIVVKIDKGNCEIKIYKIQYKSSGHFFSPISSEDVEALVFDGNCVIRYDADKKAFVCIYMTTTVSDFFYDNFRNFERNWLNESNILSFEQFLNSALKKNEKKVNLEKRNLGKEIYKMISSL